MRASALVVASSLFVVTGAAARPAIAEPAIAYSYEVEKAEANPDRVLILWPRTCQASGRPLGTIDLALNPDWASRMNETDYEVIVEGKTHTIIEHCIETARLYALPSRDFPRSERPSTADDSAIGQPEAGVPFAILPALDAIDLRRRVTLLGTDPRVLAASFRFAKPLRDERTANVTAVHDVLAVEDVGPTAFSVVPKRVRYTYVDGTTETRAYVAAARPDASKGRGGMAAVAETDAGPAAEAGADATAAPVTNDGAARDGGTRWVFLAAVVGLLTGGLFAFYKKKRERGGGQAE